MLDEEQAAKDLAEAELLLASDPTGLGWLGWFGSPLAFAVLLGMTGVFGIFLFNQTISLLNALAAQPQWAQYVGYGGLILFGICVLYAFLRFVLLYVRLGENRQLRSWDRGIVAAHGALAGGGEVGGGARADRGLPSHVPNEH